MEHRAAVRLRQHAVVVQIQCLYAQQNDGEDAEDHGAAHMPQPAGDGVVGGFRQGPVLGPRHHREGDVMVRSRDGVDEAEAGGPGDEE